jgi:hypothetical protein
MGICEQAQTRNFAFDISLDVLSHPVTGRLIHSDQFAIGQIDRRRGIYNNFSDTDCSKKNKVPAHSFENISLLKQHMRSEVSVRFLCNVSVDPAGPLHRNLDAVMYQPLWSD